MWLFTTEYFASAVQHRDKPGTLIIRFREKAQADAFSAQVARVTRTTTSVEETIDADYLYRAEVSRKTLQLVMKDNVRNLTYDNFKNACTDGGASMQWREVLMSVWQTLCSFQTRKAWGLLYNDRIVNRHYGTRDYAQLERDTLGLDDYADEPESMLLDEYVGCPGCGVLRDDAEHTNCEHCGWKPGEEEPLNDCSCPNCDIDMEADEVNQRWVCLQCNYTEAME